MRCSVDYKIVKREALIHALITNAPDARSWQPARLNIGEERQQVGRTKLAFDIGAGASARSGTRFMTNVSEVFMGHCHILP